MNYIDVADSNEASIWSDSSLLSQICENPLYFIICLELTPVATVAVRGYSVLTSMERYI